MVYDSSHELPKSRSPLTFFFRGRKPRNCVASWAYGVLGIWSLRLCLKFQSFVFCPLQKAEVPSIEIECLAHFPVLVKGHLAQLLE